MHKIEVRTDGGCLLGSVLGVPVGPAVLTTWPPVVTSAWPPVVTSAWPPVVTSAWPPVVTSAAGVVTSGGAVVLPSSPEAIRYETWKASKSTERTRIVFGNEVC